MVAIEVKIVVLFMNNKARRYWLC